MNEQSWPTVPLRKHAEGEICDFLIGSDEKERLMDRRERVKKASGNTESEPGHEDACDYVEESSIPNLAGKRSAIHQPTNGEWKHNKTDVCSCFCLS